MSKNLFASIMVSMTLVVVSATTVLAIPGTIGNNAPQQSTSISWQ
jgi:hypothetical protein